MFFKLIICGERFYQELPLQDDTNELKIGTEKDCKIRINRALAQSDFEVSIYKNEGNWKIRCIKNSALVVPSGGLMPEAWFEVGSRFSVYINGSSRELFSVELYVDFPVKNKDYDMKISYSEYSEVSIGGMDCDIQIADSEAYAERFVVSSKQSNLYIRAVNSKYGLSVNGIPCNQTSVEVKNKDFFSICGYQFFVFNGDLYTSSDGRISTNLSNMVIRYEKNHFEYPKFIKNVRQQYVTPDTKITILDPKQMPSKPENSLLKSMIPALISIVMIVLFRGVMSGRNNTFIYYSIGMMMVGLVTSVITYVSSGKKYVKDMAEREKRYRQYLAEQEEKIQELRNKEHEIACLQSATVVEDIERVAEFDSRLFEKKKEHNDYLNVNLGRGIVHTSCPVDYKKQEYVDTDDYLLGYPESIHDKYELIEDMPVNVNLKELNAIGFVGNRNKLYQMAKNMIVNLSTEHFYQDLKLFYVIEEEDIPQFDWARWLQNSYMGDNVIRNFMYDENSAKIVLEYLYEELSYRDGLKADEIDSLHNVIVFVYRSQKISNHPIMQYVEKASSLGFCFIFMEEYPEMLNEFCQKRVFLKDDCNIGLVQDADDGEKQQKFEYQHISRDMAEQAALKLACVYVDEFNLESSLTKNISLFELLDIRSASDLDLKERWSNSKIFETMAAPLGVKNGGEMVCLDLHEKYHGPHGLVAGTTGSGKSEILQSYILSMATLFHPYEVGFIIIDFKGGGMVNQFKNLPHLNGAITNIDGREINRSLLSIRAELRKRQELFAEAEVNHIDEYIKEYKKGNASVPLPHLILIVDEFAELKSEQPDFMKELISTARIGRSLGVHLILATQKPSGVVNDQIWSNSKFKLCLKVQNKQDSNEVLKSPLAAEIREPGRAYLQVGNNEIFQLFQSAYSGGPAKNNELGAKKKYKLSKVLLSGQREIFFEQKIENSEEGETQLDAIVKHIGEYFETTGLEKLPNICLPPLQEIINHSINDYQSEVDMIDVPIGMFDDPNRQSQKITGINLTLNNIFILGSSQMGKTNMLQTLIKGIAMKYSPEDVNIYIMDFATMILKNFETLAHVGGVVTAGESEKLKNLFKILFEQIAIRKKILSKMGLSSFAAYREAGYRELPQIVVILDNVTAFKEMSGEVMDSFSTLCREGLSLGITVVAANTVTGGIGIRLLNYFSTRVAFTCNSKSEYSSVFERCKLEPAEIPGRAIVKLDKEYYECQTYLAFEGEKEIDRTKSMKRFIKDINVKYKECKRAELIPFIPEQYDAEYLENLADNSGVNYRMAVGLDFSNTKPGFVDFTKHPQIGFYERPGMGKINLIKHILSTFDKNKENYPYELYIVDSMEKTLEEFADLPATTGYGVGAVTAIEYIRAIHDKMVQRNEALAASEEFDLSKEKFIILILNSSEYVSAICDNSEALGMYTDIVKKYKSLKVCSFLTDLDNTPIGFGSNAIIKLFREDKVFFLFDDIDNLAVVDVSLATRKLFRQKLEKGEAFRVVNGGLEKMKTPAI